MKSDQIVEVLSRSHGQIMRAKWTRKLKTLKGVTAKIEKITETSVRSVDYNSQMRVQMKREVGELPETPQPLPWGQWKKFPYLVEHNGKEYVRFCLCYGNVKPVVKFKKNGRFVDKEKIEHLVLTSEVKEKSDTPLCLTIGVEALKQLKLNHKVYKSQ